MNTRLVIAVGLALLSSLALAQGRGGGMGMMMGGGRGGDAFLLQRPDVQTDLKLTADQKSKLEQLQAKMREAMESMRGQGGDREAMMQRMGEMRRESDAQIKQILTADQQARLREIGIQLAGNRAVFRAEVQEALGLTPAQREELRAMQEAMQEEMRANMERVQNQEIDREEARALGEKAQAKMNDQIAAMLTADQKSKLKTMGGAPFKADPNWRPQRGG